MKKNGTLGIAVLSMILIAVLCSTVLGMTDDLPTEGTTPGPPGGNSWPHYECDMQLTCGPGFLRDGGLNYSGCDSTQPGCGGPCYSCEGSPQSEWRCIKSQFEFQSCEWPDPDNPSICCGAKRSHECSTTAPSGFDGTPPPNGCYCVGAGSDTGSDCFVAVCYFPDP